jgi:histidinol dehydrogenase
MNTSMRIIQGFSAGQSFVARGRSLTEREVSTELLDGLAKLFGSPHSPEEATAHILADVRSRGDTALGEWSRRIDGADLQHFAVDPDEIEAAFEETPSKVRESLAHAARRIRTFHEKQPRTSWLDWGADGSALGQIVRPLERVGVYVPGGRAAYPSSLLMAVVPAQVAGVKEIIVCSPPKSDGHVAPVILAAAKVVGISRVFALGGAQAVAALAYGTASVPRVDKIVGAGGLFVTLAKRQVFGAVGIDGLYGPTETLLIADDSAEASWVAADLLAQAEHDPLATSILITDRQALADAVSAEADRQMNLLPRRAIVAQALAGQGAIIVVANMDEAITLANVYAPEHLCLLVREPWALVGKVRNAGGIFVGHHSSEALGDYAIGPSHIMPTSATARFSSPLNVNDFIKLTSVFALSPPGARALGDTAATLAEAEGLHAHASAIRIRDAGL